MPERIPASNRHPTASGASRPSPARGFRFAVPLVVTVIVVGLALAFGGGGGGSGGGDPCASIATDGGVVLLVDLLKPMAGSGAGGVLHELSLRLDAGTELRVVAVTGRRSAPREVLGRLCRPYDNEALAVVAAKDAAPTVRDCDDLPAQVPPELRRLATAFCAERGALRTLLDSRVAETADLTEVGDAHLVEALEETIREMAPAAAAGHLYVLSDMMQHARWYSHLDLDWTAWGFADFAERRDALGPKSLFAGDPVPRVTVFYVPRRGLTDLRRPKEAHWDFWRGYFAGAEVGFEERTPLPAYAARRLLDAAAEATAAAEERTTLERERRESERLITVIGRERTTLAERSAATQADNDRRHVRIAALLREATTLAAERVRLAADVRTAQADATPAASPTADDPSRTDAAADGTRSLAAACELTLRPGSLSSLGEEQYLEGGEPNYGSAMIAVRYAVDRDGAVVASDMSVDRNVSSAASPEHFDVLAEDAVRVLRTWRFALDCADDGLPPVEQWRTATFTYRRKCVGPPIPRCRTVRAEVADAAS